MGICNYAKETFSCSLPKNNIHVLTRLSKEAHPTSGSLSAHFFALYSFHGHDALFIPARRGAGLKLCMLAASLICTCCFCMQRKERPTPRRKITSHLLI